MRFPAWVNVTPGVPIVSDFGTTRGMGTPICINAATDEAYYLAAGDIVTLLAGSGGGGSIIDIDGGDASNSGTPYLALDGGDA